MFSGLHHFNLIVADKEKTKAFYHGLLGLEIAPAMLARADEGWVLGMGYSTQRGYAHTHPFAGDIRFRMVRAGWSRLVR